MSTGLVYNFRDQIAEFAELQKRTINETHRMVCIKLFSAIILDTPVDTGLAAGNWQVGYGEIPAGILPRYGPQGAINDLTVNVRALVDVPTFLANNVPYTVLLEYGTASYGFSPKAPAGMVRVNIARFQKLVSEALAEAKAKVRSTK